MPYHSSLSSSLLSGWQQPQIYSPELHSITGHFAGVKLPCHGVSVAYSLMHSRHLAGMLCRTFSYGCDVEVTGSTCGGLQRCRPSFGSVWQCLSSGSSVCSAHGFLDLQVTQKQGITASDSWRYRGATQAVNHPYATLTHSARARIVRIFMMLI